jgi:hypothetical protein
MRKAILALLLVAGSAAPALARGEDPAPMVQPPAAAVQPPQKDSVEKDLDRVICKPRQATGSRLPSAKVCRTQREWNLIEIENRRTLEKAQDNRGYKTN